MAEKNPLQIHSEVSVNKAINKYKNCVGRPTKKNEIKFSAPPKSIISILLNKEKTKVADLTTSNNELSMKSEVQIKQSGHEVCYLEGKQINEIDSNKSLKIQRDKLYKCKHLDCIYTTKFPSNLWRHKITHTTEQPYVCDECTFRSKFISSLKTHKRLHRDERPFACQLCKYKCNSASNLKKHCFRKHSK